jgi:HAD superfamily phosphoserine phosphatase-like hydrolase
VITPRSTPRFRSPGDPEPRYRTVILDADSTLTRLEGIDWLAARRGAGTMALVAGLTERSMAGEIPLDAVYGERLALVRPSRADVAALVSAYISATVPGAMLVLDELRDRDVQVVVVSGGLFQAVAPFARALGICADHVRAVNVEFDSDGAYAGFDHASPLTTQHGKRDVARALLDDPRFARPALAVGDGATDAAMRGVADAFAAFTGVVRREPVVAVADHVIATYAELLALVFPPFA